MSELAQIAANRLGLEGPFVGPPAHHQSCLGAIFDARAGLIIADNGWSLVVVECQVPGLPPGIRLGRKPRHRDMMVGTAAATGHAHFDEAHAVFASNQLLAEHPRIPAALLEFVSDCERLGGIELGSDELRTWQTLAVTPADLDQLWRAAGRALALGRDRGLIT